MDKKALIQALKDFAQQTSNETVGMVSFPIDLANEGLNKIGAGTDEPIGGSVWMEKKGITKPVPDGLPKTLGSVTGIVLPLACAKGKFIVKALRNGN